MRNRLQNPVWGGRNAHAEAEQDRARTAEIYDMVDRRLRAMRAAIETHGRKSAKTLEFLQGNLLSFLADRQQDNLYAAVAKLDLKALARAESVPIFADIYELMNMEVPKS